MLKRYLHDEILRTLRRFPAILLTGARQVGKSTLAQQLISPSWNARYVTLDDRANLDAALRDPDGFVDALPAPIILDEVQRAPDVLLSIKRAIDRNRSPGSWLLTGSANIMTLSSVSDSLAGRIALKTLYPFSWPEIEGAPLPSVIPSLFSAASSRELIRSLPSEGKAECRALVEKRILSGGYPPAALMKGGTNRAEWFDSYLRTYVERDLLQIKSIEQIPDFNRLITLASFRTGGLLNMSDLSREIGLPYTTLRRYLNLLEVTYQVHLLPPYHANISKRLVKTPKLYSLDTGLACSIRAADDWPTLERQAGAGALVETWVAAELLKLLPLLDRRLRLYFWRTGNGEEVDFLVERGIDLIGIEVKWGARIVDRDVANLHACAEDLKGRLRMAVILYSGSQVVALSPRIVAMPFDVFFGITRRPR